MLTTAPGRGRLRAASSAAMPAIVLVALAALVVLPLWEVSAGAFGGTSHSGADWTTSHLLAVFEVLQGSGIVRSTVLFVLGATTLSVTIGAWLAWLTERTEIPLRRLIYGLVLLPLVIPGVLSTAAWRLLLSERIGLINAAFDLVGFVPFRTDAYTLGSMIWVAGTDGITLPFLLVAAALRGLDPTLEEAALVAGPRSRASATVVLPLIAPAIIAATLVSVVRNLGRFEGPVILGLPGGVRVLSSQIYLLVQTFPRDANLAAAFALVLLVPSFVALLLYLRSTAVVGRFATIGGRARGATRRRPARPRLLAVLAVGVLVVSVVLPVAVLVYASVLPFYEPPSARAMSNLTLRNYETLLLSGPVLGPVLRNTVVVMASAAAMSVTLGGLAAWVSLRGTSRWRRMLDPLATVPVAIPGVVLSLALLWLYLRVPIPLYASLGGIAVGVAVLSLPYATRTVQVALLRVAPELEEASAVSGAAPSRTLVRVVAPLALPGIVAAAVLVAMRSMQILTVPLLVGGPGDEVLSVRVFQLYESARFPELSALGIAMIVALVALFALERAFQRIRADEHVAEVAA